MPPPAAYQCSSLPSVPSSANKDSPIALVTPPIPSRRTPRRQRLPHLAGRRPVSRKDVGNKRCCCRGTLRPPEFDTVHLVTRSEVRDAIELEWGRRGCCFGGSRVHDGENGAYRSESGDAGDPAVRSVIFHGRQHRLHLSTGPERLGAMPHLVTPPRPRDSGGQGTKTVLSLCGVPLERTSSERVTKTSCCGPIGSAVDGDHER
jgi:hypothetical protein